VPAALLVDLDGTLIDSEPWYKRTEVAALNGFGVPITLEEMDEFTGLTLPAWLGTINSRYGAQLAVEEFLEGYRPQMEVHVAQNVQMFPDAKRFLERVEGIPSVLVTSSMKWYVDAVLRRFPVIAESVGAVVCEADVSTGKPDPEPYLLAAERVGVEPSRTWVIEDALNGVRSGLAAGCHVVGVDRGRTGALSDSDVVVHNLDDILMESASSSGP
jgi:HAD superfamily hydrolase (TIGR01509 family)